LKALAVASEQVFVHVEKVVQFSYPAKRTLELLEAISNDLTEKVVVLMQADSLLEMPFSRFATVSKQLSELAEDYLRRFAGFRKVLKQ